MIIITPDGLRHEGPPGGTIRELVETLDPGLAAEAIAAKVDGRVVDLSLVLDDGARVEILTLDRPEALEVYRHSCAHIMATAVKRLFPRARIAIGPVIEEGFYYDFDIARPFTPEDLERIETEMRRVIEADYPFIRRVVEREEALKFFEEQGEWLKVEILQGIPPQEILTIYQCGEFQDLCRGPHLPSTGRVKAFKLLAVAGAYWRGSEANPMLQRIYGTAFATHGELEEFLHRREEARRRDHRRLGKELGLYSIQEGAGGGLIFWHPKGALIREVIEEFWWKVHRQAGYQRVYTPHTARLGLWQTSGHLDFYQEYMYPPMELEGVAYQLKPMNCPFHILIYQSEQRSYRDLPVRLAELGTVYRYERSGVLHGLLRVRGFTVDDAHIFCLPRQLVGEIGGVLDLCMGILRTFGFQDYEVDLSTRPERAPGELEDWERATEALEAALKARGLAYRIAPGEGAFYGPKIDLKVRDVLGRAWQCSTIQVDFNLPQRFQVTYIGEDGREHHPIMVHRAVLGSLERFFGVLIEQYGGAFPTWLAPVQVRVLPITNAQVAYARQVADQLRARGIRVELDDRPEKVGYRIRQAEVEKIPYMAIVGEREVVNQAVSVRRHGMGDRGSRGLSAFVEVLAEEIGRQV